MGELRQAFDTLDVDGRGTVPLATVRGCPSIALWSEGPRAAASRAPTFLAWQVRGLLRGMDVFAQDPQLGELFDRMGRVT